MARPIGNSALEGPRLAEGIEDGVGQLLDTALVTAADVVCLADATVRQDPIEGPAVIRHVQPLTSMFAVLVERQRAVIEGVRGEERNDLLRVLPFAVVVARDRDGHGRS